MQSAATMMETDPYSTPTANPYGHTGLANVGPVSAAAVQQLAATKPWVRFISIMTFICSGFMLLGAAGMAMMGAVGVSGAMGPASRNQAANPFVGGMGFGIAALYVVLAIVYLFPGVKLWKYGSAIAELIRSGRDEDLVAALNQQRSFWKFVGIMMIAIICVYILAIIGFVIMGAAVAMKAH